jgi:hypothetical protein
MAFGTHWEWRAFGSVPLSTVLHVVNRCDKHFGPEDSGNQHTDEYLWAPGCDVNVKLRDKELKFKRLLEKTEDGCELWTEEEDEMFPFPLADAALDFIRSHMKVALPERVDEIRGSLEDFKRFLPSFDPPVRIIPVKKYRIEYDCVVDDATLIVELAEVMEPVSIWSIGIEGEDLIKPPSSKVDKAASRKSLTQILQLRDTLKLPGRMTVKGYLDMLAEW